MKIKIQPLTRAQILKRIKQGPAKFNELAQTKHHGCPARTEARKHCDVLESAGTILQVYLGACRYYVYNSPAAIRAAILHQIAENSEPGDGGCIVWTGYSDPARGPTMRQTLVEPSAGVNVRRWLFSDLIGRDLAGYSESVKMRDACDENCINRAHMVRKTRSEILTGIPKPMSVKLAVQKAAIKRWGKNPDAAEIIRASEKSTTELAAELGMTRSNVWSIRAMRTHKLRQNHFSGLGARHATP